ncbi:WD40/YVTN/BNR-like repeat-containing protein [Chloroflexota bacterium]
MKKKISKMLGVGLTLILLTSLMIAAPVAGSTLSWGSEGSVTDLKDLVSFTLGPDNVDIVDLAVNGATMYAVPGASVANTTYKSTDGGATWSEQSTKTDTIGDVDKTTVLVAVAPDDADVVAVVTDQPEVYFSIDGGANWDDLNIPAAVDSIADIDVSVGPTHYVAIGGNIVGPVAELWTRKLAMAADWEAEYTSSGVNFTASQTIIAAVKFSPNFETDETIAVISGNATRSNFQIFRWTEGQQAWNNRITREGMDAYGTGISLATITGPILAADIALVDTYLATDETERIGFAAVAGTAGGGAWRLTDSVKKGFETWSDADLDPVGSLAYNDSSGILLGGVYGGNEVYSWLTPMSGTSPNAQRPNTIKPPSGERATLVAWSGDTAIAATSGDESAFAVSTDDGYAWNDISLIDTAFTVISDVAVNADGKKIYMTTHDATNDASVWVKDGSWTRVLSRPSLTANTAPFLVRIAPEDDSAVYVSSKTTTNMWVSKDSGKGVWRFNPSGKLTSVQDFVVESADVVHAIDGNSHSLTTNAGASWRTKVDLDLSLDSGYSITLAPNNDILVGSDDGSVSFSTDGGLTFTKMDDATDGDPVHIVADKDYVDNNIIYIAAGDEVERTKLEKDATWSSRESDDMGSDVTGIARVEDVIYVLTCDGSNSQLWRALNLRDADTAELALWSYREATSGSYELNTTPQALRISPDNKSGPRIWGIDTDDMLLRRITDPLATEGPDVSGPKDEASVMVNKETGKAYDVTFAWERYSSKYITAMDLEIATDDDFQGVVYSLTVQGIDSDDVAEIIGPTGATTTTTVMVDEVQEGYTYTATDNVGGVVTYAVPDTTTSIPVTVTTFRQVNFMPGQTYYWRVRHSSNVVTGEDAQWNSPWSKARSFTIESSVAFAGISPEVGATNTSIEPTFVWAPFSGAIGYELLVSEDPTFAILEYSHNVGETFYKSDPLAYSTTYYWKVRGVTGPVPLDSRGRTTGPAPGGPWTTGVFTTMSAAMAAPGAVDQPAQEPIIITEPGETKVQIVEVPVQTLVEQPIPSYLLWTIIAIGALLIIALIVLIVRTRRVA